MTMDARLVSRIAASGAGLALCVLIAPCGAAAARLQGDELAARRFQTGLDFARDGQYTEALTDFEGVVELYPLSPVADNALLEIARYHLEVTEDLDRAAEYAGRIVDDAAYSRQDAAPEAYIVLARASVARGHTSENLDAAIAQLQRGLGLWPDARVVPQSLFFTGEAHRHAGRFGEALDAYGRVTAEYAATLWAARASLGSAVLRAATGDPIAAMAELQGVRDRWPDTPEAETALERITILYRLYIRPPERTFTIVGEPFSTARSPRIDELLVNREGQVFFATDAGVSATDTTAAARAPTGGRPRGLVLDRRGVVTAIIRGALTARETPPLQLSLPRPGQEPKELREIDAAGVTAAGDWLIMDGDEREIHRFSALGDYRGVFVPGRVKRLAIGPNDQIAVVDRGNRIRLMAEGRELGEIPSKGPSYEIDEPLDVAFDVFGHLYVVDERQVFIFGRDRQLLRQFAPEVAPGRPRKITAFALDRFGSLFFADDDEEQIVQYQ
ncbi:MAG: tetratricopeptide repeat protein [Vicinamibacterales bacterium]|nr:tetratricopeptide repeat protein [Vicinamibacterales bacterium]